MVAKDWGAYDIGDKVRITEENEGWDLDKPYTISDADGTRHYTRYWFEERDGWYLYDDQFTAWEEPVQDEEETYVAPEGTVFTNIPIEGEQLFFVRSAKPTDDLKEGDVVDVSSATVGTPEIDPINPDYYKFPSGVELIDVSRYLTGNGAQVVQYVGRSTRLDGRNKGDVLENLRKARWFLSDEIERLEAQDG